MYKVYIDFIYGGRVFWAKLGTNYTFETWGCRPVDTDLNVD